MGHVMSSEREIDKLRFRPFPTKPIDVKLVRADNVLIGIDKKGRIYTNSRAGLDGSFVLGKWPWTESLMKSLVSMGVISQETSDRHLAAAERVEIERDRRDAFRELAEISKKFGVKFTDAQMRKLRGEKVKSRK